MRHYVVVSSPTLDLFSPRARARIPYIYNSDPTSPYLITRHQVMPPAMRHSYASGYTPRYTPS